MSGETILSLLLSIPLGLVSGLYAGLIVARYQRFAELRLQARGVILEIDFVWEGTSMSFFRRKEVPELSTIASDLIFLGHNSAGENVLSLCQDVQEAINEATAGRICSETFHSKYSNWQSQIRSLSPRWLQIVRMWGGL